MGAKNSGRYESQFSDEQWQVAIDANQRGATLKAAARLIGATHGALGAVMKRRGVVRVNQRRPIFRPTPEIDGIIRAEYPTLGSGPLAVRFGVRPRAVADRASELGVRCETSQTRRVATVMRNNANARQDYFDTWTPNMAWMLGYIWADGNISRRKCDNRLSFKCTADDRSLLEAIRTELASNAPITDRPPSPAGQGYIGRPTVSLRVCSLRIVDRLVELGIQPRKSYIDPPMPDVPTEFLPHFTRGAIDGDGSICVCNGKQLRIILVGSHTFIRQMSVAVSAAAVVKEPRPGRCGSSERLSNIGWGAKGDLLRLIDWLYPAGDYIFLKRKRGTAFSWRDTHAPSATTAVQSSPRN